RNAELEVDSQSAPTVVPDCQTRKSIERLLVSRRQVSPRASLVQFSRLSLGRGGDKVASVPASKAMASVEEKIIPVRLPAPSGTDAVARKSVGSSVNGSRVLPCSGRA